MQDSERSSKEGSWLSVGKILKDEKAQPSKLVSKLKPSSNVLPPKKHLAWYVALNSPPPPPKEKTVLVPQIKWSCPPRFDLKHCWYVAAGEGSQEREVQNLRETICSQRSPSDTWSENCDDSQIPIIPIIPIEESTVEAEMPPNLTALVSAVNVVGESNEKSLPDKLCSLGDNDVEVAAAAAAAAAIIMERKEQIDPALLLKFLANPEMVKKLMEESKSSSDPRDGTTAATILEFTSDDRATKECSKSITCGMGPQETNRCLSVPCVKGETRREYGKCAASASIDVELKPEVKTLLCSTDEENMKKSSGQYGIRDNIFDGKQEELLNPCISKPSAEEINQLITKYGGDGGGGGGGGIQSVSSPIVNNFRVHDYYQWGPNSSRCASLLPHWETMPAFPNASALDPQLVSRGMYSFAPFSPMANFGPAIPFDYNMFRHEHNPEMWGHNPGHPMNYLQGLKQTHKRKPNEMNSSKYQKPCMFFNSPRGCRNGLICPYQHGTFKEVRAGGAEKRRK